ncbi:MAG: GNAT family N-acetyltransferase [Cyanobacteria bacterium J06639_18]
MIQKNIAIRDAENRDIPSIMELICLKAEFDGCPESVQTTPEKLKDDLFGQKPLAFILVAEIDRNLVGFATYHFTYSTFLAKPCIWLDDLYIKTEYRSKGIGEGLIQNLCKIAQLKGCGRIDWTVATQNERGIKFYQRIGAKIIQKARLCRLDLEAISQNSYQ